MSAFDRVKKTIASNEKSYPAFYAPPPPGGPADLGSFMHSAAKAETGIGAFWMSTEYPLQALTNNQQKAMKEAQEIATANRWIRAAERVISQAFGTVPWHLETEDGEEVTDDSPEHLRAVRDLIEKPYKPIEGDPLNATPRTRSGLWGLTSRHMGVCGLAAWYEDETDAVLRLPSQFLYINPARLTPAGSSRRLVGWVLDADARGGGTPLPLERVKLFTLEEADDGFFPAGLVETAMASVNTGKFADRHVAGTFSSGGKLPGVFSPKAEAGILPPDVFQALEKELREANQSPDATRRSIILRGPIDFTQTAATPEQLDAVAVMNMTRDDILSLWGVPYSQLGGSSPAGLNSGGKGGYEEAALWQKAVHPRLVRFWEVMQFQLLDPLGFGLQLVLDEPTFDDDQPMYEMANKAQYLPLTNAERRALIGKPPTGDPKIDNAIVLPMTMVTYGVAPQIVEGKAKTGTPAKVPDHAVREQAEKLMKKDVERVLSDMRSDIAHSIEHKFDHIAKKPGDTTAWWNEDKWRKELEKAMKPHLSVAADAASARVEAVLGKADDGD